VPVSWWNRSCLAKTVPTPAEIVVVADGDIDGSWQLAKAYGLPVFRYPFAGGPARARNLGARKATGEILFFIDADVTVPFDVIARVAAVFALSPELAAVFGSYDDEPGEKKFFSQYRNLLHHHVHQTAREEASTFWAGCGAIRRDVFLAIGGFQETYTQPSIEDIELGYRLTSAGHKIRLCRSLQVKHWKRWDLISMSKADFLQRALPWTQLILEDGRLINDLNVRMSGRISVIFVYGIVLALALTYWRPLAIASLVPLMLSLVALNAGFYRFLWCKRGRPFTFQAIPCHWFYFFYSGLAFAVGIVRYLFGRVSRRFPSFFEQPGPMAPPESRWAQALLWLSARDLQGWRQLTS
jgi:glycosyltransferase involved in cell wall biosynthesis